MPRRSRYRDLVHLTLRSAAGPLSAIEVHDRLRDTGVGLATVYRQLNEGADAGDLVSVELPHGPTRFEHAGKPHHHHFECVACNTVFDVMGCTGGIDNLVPHGFELDDHAVILTGKCNGCV